MEKQSDKLRSLLDDAKYSVPQSLLPDLIKHITEDDSYHFFRYVQDLLEHRRIDVLLLENEEVWSQVRRMYVETFPWLDRRDLKYGLEVPEEKERNRRLVRALEKAFRGVPGNDYKEDWITEYLYLNGLSWDDVANGTHLRMEIAGIRHVQSMDPATLRLDPKAGIMGLAGRPQKELALIAGEDTSDDGSPQAPDERNPEEEEEEPEQQGPVAKMAAAMTMTVGERQLTPEDNGEDIEEPRKTPGCTPGKWDGPERSSAASAVTLLTPEASANSSLLVSPGAKTTKDPQKPTAGEDWLLSWHKATRKGRAADFHQQPYKGWLMSGPVVTLKRIANFLSDEDIDHTPNWASHIAEITEYLAYLVVNYDKDKHSWGYELREAIEMLRVHITYEDYYYGKPPLTLQFDETPLKNERTPPAEGSNIEIKPQKAVTRDPLAPRNLLHGPPEGVWETMYNIPNGKLYDPFLKELRKDEKLYWAMTDPKVPHSRRPATQWCLENHDRAIPHERANGFNMCEEEDNAFIACMQKGPLRTYEELKRSCRFKYHAGEHGEAGDAKLSRNKQLLQFSKFRGANRAALTFALRTLGSQTREIQAISSPWRKLVVRTPEQREKKRYPGIIWQAAKLGPDQIPKDDFDPMAYNFWHTMMLESQGSWAQKKIPELEKEKKTLVGRDEDTKYPPVPKTNFKGPYTAVEVSEERYNNEQLLKHLERTLRDLETASRLSPRPILTEVLINAQLGRQGIPPAREEKGMFPDDVVEQSDNGEREVRIMEHDDVDLELLQRMSHVSINDMMLKLVPKEWSPRKRIFADRVQTLVADISPASIFSSAGKQATLEEVVDAVNARANGPVKGVWFTHEEAVEYLEDLEIFKRISINRKDTATTYSRPEATIHPEQTFRWDFVFTTRPRPRPTFLSYEALAELDPMTRRMDQDITTPLLKGTAWRLGKTIRHLEQALASDSPTEAQRAALRSAYRDLTRNWERKVETHRDDRGTRRTMDYRDVIRYAEPRRFNPAWADDDQQIEDGADLGPVYAGMLREAHENKSMLWPARWRQVPSETGQRTVWSRDGVWSWARPDVRRCWRYFHIRRWPVHLQSKETQEKIRRSAGRGLPCAVMGSIERGAVVPGEGRAEEGVEAMEVDAVEGSRVVDADRMDEGE